MGSLVDLLADLAGDPVAWVLLIGLLLGIAILGAAVVNLFRSRRRGR
jgi:hypothetical protein